MGDSQRRQRQRREIEGRCLHCGGDRDSATMTCSSCLNKQAKRDKSNTAATRKSRIAHGLCPRCGEPALGTQTCRSCLDEIKHKSASLRKDVINAYGGTCVCCGEDGMSFLTIDHIDNDGAAHRDQLFRGSHSGGGRRFYRWITKNNYPNNLQVLCYNCNIGKFINGGTCPHAQNCASPGGPGTCLQNK